MSNRRSWQPYVTASGSDGFGGHLPQPGQVIAYMNREAWRVIEVTDRDRANWCDETVAAWRRAGEPEWTTWDGRERVVFAEPARNPAANGKDRRGLVLYPWAYGAQWWPLPDPYPACVDCGLLWPCPCEDRNQAAAEALNELDRLGGILPGCCWACGEPVSSRHHSVVFDGENLLLPGGDAVAFHVGRSHKTTTGSVGHRVRCRYLAEQYERRWVAAGPGRHPRLSCPGTMWRHSDYTECTVGGLCPGGQATHEDVHHCFTATYTHIGTTAWVRLEPLTNCGHANCGGPKLVAESAGELPEPKDQREGSK